MKKSLKASHLVWILAALLVAVALGFSMIKEGLFIDEIYSWGLSNSYYKPFVNSCQVFDRWLEGGREFHQYLTVQQGEQFAWGSVFFNQAADVHPPLYYLLFHGICSFMPDRFNLWQGLAMNLVFYTGCLAMIYLTGRELFGDWRRGAAAMVLWGLSPGGISTALYVRMYMLSTLLTMCCVWLHLRLLNGGQTPRRLAGTFAVTLLGLLTQYYFVFVAFFLAAGYDLYLMKKRQWKKAGIYSAVMFGAVGAMVGIFPGVITQLTRPGEFVAAETRSNVLEGRVAAQNFISYVSNMNRDFFGGFLLWVIFAAVILAAFCLGIKFAGKLLGLPSLGRPAVENETAPAPRTFEGVWLLLVCLCSFLLVVRLAVVPGVRYIYNLYPLMVLAGVWCVTALADGCFFHQRMRTVFLGALMGAMVLIDVVSYGQGSVQYLYPEKAQAVELAGRYRELDCLYIDNYQNAPLTQDLLQLEQYRGVYITPEESIDRLDEILAGRDMSRGLIVYIDTNAYWSSGYDWKQVLQKIVDKTGVSQCEYLFSDELSHTFFIGP